jgi:RimJ/RimL family protein N-acetyltransferase
MKWTVTAEPARFPDMAEAWMLRDPVRNTVALTVLRRLRGGAPADGVSLAWLTMDDGTVCGVSLHTPGHPVILTALDADITADAMRGLADALRGAPREGVTGPLDQVEAFRSVWHRPETGRMPQRLYRLGTLEAARADGAPRVAEGRDADLLVAWFEAFLDEAEPEAAAHRTGTAAQVRWRVAQRELILWESAGQPVALAGFSTPVAGMSRVGPVYTPPGLRRHGYGSAVTHAASAAAKTAGATEVVLFTDLDNATSNAIYQRLGYRPVTDFATVWFA